MTTFVAEWPDGIYVKWRALNWGEYRKFKQLLQIEPLGISLKIYSTVRLEGPELEQLPAGIAAFIAESLMVNNPFGGSYKDIAKQLEFSRASVLSSYNLSAKALVAHVFNYKLEDIDKLDSEEFYSRVALAEFITGRNLDPVNPEIDAKKQQKKGPKRKALTETQSFVLDRIRQERRSG